MLGKSYLNWLLVKIKLFVCSFFSIETSCIFYFPRLGWATSLPCLMFNFKVRTKYFIALNCQNGEENVKKHTNLWTSTCYMWFFPLPNIFIEFFHFFGGKRKGVWSLARLRNALVKKYSSAEPAWPHKKLYIIQPSSSDPYVLCRELAIARFFRNCSAKQYSHSNIYLIKVSPGMLNVQKMRFIMSEV